MLYCQMSLYLFSLSLNFRVFKFIFCFQVCGSVLCNAETVFKTEILNSSKDYNHSLTCFLAGSTCKLLFCNNSLTKFTACFPAVPVWWVVVWPELIFVQTPQPGSWDWWASRPTTLGPPGRPGEPPASHDCSHSCRYHCFCAVTIAAANLGLRAGQADLVR